MISTILFVTVIAVAFFSAENLISTIVGVIVSTGVTQWLKNQTGIYGTAAAILAFVIAFVVALVAFLVSTYLTGGELGWDAIPQAGLQIFALATMAYKLVLADKE